MADLPTRPLSRLAVGSQTNYYQATSDKEKLSTFLLFEDKKKKSNKETHESLGHSSTVQY